MKSERSLLLGGVVMEGIAAQNAFSSVPDKGKAAAAAIIGFVMLTGAVIERRTANRRKNNKSSNRNLP